MLILRFRSAAAQAIIHDVVKPFLTGKDYSSEEVAQWTSEICTNVKTQLKGV